MKFLRRCRRFRVHPCFSEEWFADYQVEGENGDGLFPAHAAYGILPVSHNWEVMKIIQAFSW